MCSSDLSARKLAEAEDEAAVEDWQTRKAAGQVTYVPATEVRERLGFPPGDPA